jgi:nucleosome binding factor SPN SPT16 subunit
LQVPFHISTIKSVVKSDEGHKSFLRFNFYSLGAALPKDAPAAFAAALRDHPSAAYIRTLNFMCTADPRCDVCWIGLL